MSAKKVTDQEGNAVTTNELAEAFRAAMEAAKPKEKKTIFTRKSNSPWTPKDGSPKLKLKRKVYQHGILLTEKMMTNKRVDLFNKVRPGSYVDDWVKITRRRDKGLDITWPMRSHAQRAKLPHVYGLRNLDEILERCISEAENPKPRTEDND